MVHFSLTDDRGLIEVALDPFETEIFGFPVASLRRFQAHDSAGANSMLDQADHFLTAHQVKVVVSRREPSTPLENQWLQARGFTFVELSLTPSLRIPRKPYTRFVVPLGRATEAQLPDIIAIAESTFTHDRFHADGRFDEAAIRRRYGRWVQNALCDGDAIYYMKSEDRIAGFGIVRAPNPTAAHLTLAGLHPDYKHGLYGMVLFTSLCDQLMRQGMQTVTSRISTTNIDVLNLYAALDFTFSAPSIVYHRWMPDLIKSRQGAAEWPISRLTSPTVPEKRRST